MAPTYLDTLAAFTSFLAAYTHTLLYLRALYPRASFVHARFHNAAVYQSRHPLVCDWVRDAVAAVREELLAGSVARIAIVVFGTAGGATASPGSAGIMERYMFDVSTFPVVSKHERNMAIEWDDAGHESDASDPAVTSKAREKEWDVHVDTDLSEQFRAALIALTTRTSQLAPLPSHCSFNISMELKDDAHVDPPIRHPQPWIPVQPSLQKTARKAPARHHDAQDQEETGSKTEGGDLGGVRVTPIRSVQAGVFRFETWVEEGKAKLDSAGTDTPKTTSASSVA
ncbi:DNA-binding protein [Ampelomyces quisqualis]|uniref:DNA-binding protein n=1 Tax=Ampelomyces quisqualis TaxID=50730 RepID=A0A6A5QKQ7_AMPQU|nr:DNA-binding protein [Ampelomyces quisqualis]